MECQAWAAHVLQSQRSYTLVALYRSQKGNQSWLAVLTVLLDACALWQTVPRDKPQIGSPATFEVALRAVTDLTSAFRLKPKSPPTDRLPCGECQRLLEALAHAGLKVDDPKETERRLAEIRMLYEPYVYALSQYLYMELPAWAPFEGDAPSQASARAGADS